jgi:hypothetical protein
VREDVADARLMVPLPRGLGHCPPVDGLALASVLTSAVAVVSTASVAVWNANRAAKTAREARVDQRAADAYLKVLSLAEQEAQWLEVRVDHLKVVGSEEAYYSGLVPLSQVPAPAFLDRAMASALLAAYGSAEVRARYATWRDAADSTISSRTNPSPHPKTCGTSAKTSNPKSGQLAKPLQML